MAETIPAQRERPVYVVEDDEDVARSLGLLLKLSGFEPTCFRSAELFLDSIGSLRRGCLLLDIRLPGRDGISALGDVRKMNIDWPAILMTGHFSSEMAALAVKAGASDILEKPFSPDDLVAALDRAAREIEEPAAQG
ncbi:MAG: response regulator transcription factor [Allosphingosinicella sp.]